MLPIFNRYPYTNLHELNLDWILTKIKEVDARGDAMAAATETTKEATANANRAAGRIDEALDDIDRTVNAAFDNFLSGVGSYTVNKTGAVSIKGGSLNLESDTSITETAHDGDITIEAQKDTRPAANINLRGDSVFVDANLTVTNRGGGVTILDDNTNSLLSAHYDGNTLSLEGITRGHIGNVVISGIETIADSQALTPETRANLAASCGYVDRKIKQISDALAPQIGENTESIEELSLVAQRFLATAPAILRVEADATQDRVTIDSAKLNALKDAAYNGRPITLVVDTTAENARMYMPVSSIEPLPTDYASISNCVIYFANGIYDANLNLSTGTLVFD